MSRCSVKTKTMEFDYFASPLSTQDKGERADGLDSESDVNGLDSESVVYESMSIHRLLFQLASTIKIQLSMLV